MKTVHLRKTIPSDLDTLFDYQADDEAGYMAAFVNPTSWKDREAYRAKWEKLLQDDTISSYTILYNGEIAGSIGKWLKDAEPQITYGISKALWGKGLASAAVELFLKEVNTRPLFGSAAADNVHSIKILERAGFKKTGTDRGFAHARNAEIEEVIFRLD